MVRWAVTGTMRSIPTDPGRTEVEAVQSPPRRVCPEAPAATMAGGSSASDTTVRTLDDVRKWILRSGARFAREPPSLPIRSSSPVRPVPVIRVQATRPTVRETRGGSRRIPTAWDIPHR